jgi:hypothetical protein
LSTTFFNERKSANVCCGEVELQKLRERLCLMSDEELVNFRKQVRSLSEPWTSVTPDPWKAQLAEARAEWRRRHPKAR